MPNYKLSDAEYLKTAEFFRRTEEKNSIHDFERLLSNDFKYSWFSANKISKI